MTWFKNLKIRTKLTLTFLAIGLIPLIIFGLFTITAIKSELTKDIFIELVRTANTKEGVLFSYLDSIETRTIDFSSDGFIRDSLKKINTGEDVQKTTELLSLHLIKNKKSLDKTIGGILVINSNGIIVASTNYENIDIIIDESKEIYFIEGKKKVFISELKGHNYFGLDNPLVVSAPLTDKETGELLGILANVFDSSKMQDIFSGKAQVDKGALTGEQAEDDFVDVYVVNGKKEMFVHPHLGDDEHIPYMIVNTLPVNKCLLEGKEIIQVYTNYRGEEVLGASMCIVDKGWIVLAEINVAAAFSSVSDMQSRLLIIIFVFLVLVVFATFFISKTISMPIKKLQKGTKIIAAGNLNYRVDIKTGGDEIEQLANAFNNMTSKLQSSYKNLEWKVKERTKDLYQKVIRIEQLNKSLENAKSATFNILEDLDEEKKKVEEKVKERTKELEEEKTKLSHIARNMEMGAILLNNQGEVIFINRKAKNILDLKNDREAIIDKLFTKFSKARVKEHFIKCSHGEPSCIPEIEVDNKIFEIRFSCLSNHNESIFGHLIWIRDITEDKQLERSKSEFVSLASHQLRTPLSTINWYAEMLLSDDVGKVTDGQKRYIEKVYKNSRRMAKLVQALLNVSKIELGTLAVKTEQVDLKEIIESVIDELFPQIQGRKLKIEMEYAKDLPIVATDPDLIRIILQNILSNAVKYNIDNGRISIGIKKQRTDILFTISDTGLGIPESQQSKIFTKLFRADNAKENDTDGTGLGLYIAKEMLYKLGGKIWFKSEENKGTTFFVTLPVDGEKSKDKKVS